MDGPRNRPDACCVNPLLKIVMECWGGPTRLEQLYDAPESWAGMRLQAAKLLVSELRLKKLKPRDLARPEVLVRDIPDAEYWAGMPIVWLKSRVAISLMDATGYELIRSFSRGHVWEIGAGSGYHAGILHRMGARVYATDCPSNAFRTKFYPVASGVDDDHVRRVADEGGAALYFWPSFAHHELSRWVRLGGRRVITVGCYEPDHFWLRENPGRPAAEAPTVCPAFPPEGWRNKFRLVGRHTPPHSSETDKSVADEMELFELTD